jgi:DNA invertase Pin-like site-specific DNA recombinase
MGKKNKIVKLTPRKIRYIIRYKTNNYSTKSIAKDLKISESTVKRVWMHWIRTKMPLNISEFGRKKKKIDEASEDLILKITLISISESFDVVEASTKSKISVQGVWRRS